MHSPETCITCASVRQIEPFGIKEKQQGNNVTRPENADSDELDPTNDSYNAWGLYTVREETHGHHGLGFEYLDSHEIGDCDVLYAREYGERATCELEHEIQNLAGFTCQPHQRLSGSSPRRLHALWPLLPLFVVIALLPLPSWVDAATRTLPHLPPCSLDDYGDLFIKQKHYFYHEGKNLPIIIEDSDRLSHKITNRILQILLESVAGYPDVRIFHCYPYDNHNITAALNRVSGKMVSSHCHEPVRNTVGIQPDTMVNMEAWMVAGFNKAPWLDTGKLVDAGPLGPQGQMGWFVPKFIVDDLWSNGKHVLDHWKALQMTKLTKHLSLWGDKELESLQPTYRLRAYKNSKCKGKRKKCATLFSTYREGVDAGILQAQIESLDLYVDIVWLKDKLTGYVRDKVAAGKPVLFFNWQPNIITATGQYVRINFPETHALHKDGPVDCDFPVNQLTKVAWEPIKTAAPEAYHIISKMSFTDLEYDDLLSMASKLERDNYRSLSSSSSISPLRDGSQNVEKMACKWLKDNPERWEKWLPKSLKEKPKIYLGGLFPLSGKLWADEGLVEGAQLALDLVNQDADTLANYQLEMIVNDTQCDEDVAMGEFITLQRQKPAVVAILGPGCSDPAERLASLAHHFHLLMVSYGAQAEVMSDSNKYPFFFRTIPPDHLYRDVYPALFEKLGWQVVGTLTEEGGQLPEYHLSLLKKLHNLDAERTAESSALVVRQKYLNYTNKEDVVSILEEFKEQGVRVIIADVHSNVARLVMCHAFKMGMTGYEGYVWFLPSWYARHWQDVEYYNSEPNPLEISQHYLQPMRESVPCTTDQVERAADGHFVLARSTIATPDTKVVGGITVKDFEKMYARRCGDKNIDSSRFAGFVYDAVWTLAKGLDMILKQKSVTHETLTTQTNARKLRSAIGNLSFSGVSGWISFEDGHSDRVSDLLIQQLFHNETRLVGRYKPQATGSGGTRSLLLLDTASIRWLSPVGAIMEELKFDGTSCFIEGVRMALGVSCTVASVILISLICVVIIVAVLGLLLVLKYRCDTKMKELKATHERMRELGLLPDENSQLLAVDGWEIPLENIVQNRELGEGAFGAVMGGEMLKDNDGWVAVAVKQLKVPHTMEEKLEFFREVDMMKLFKHKNIVELLGVCTRKQPVLAVMEFMLHGDLKTYLLSRRNLVGQGVKEAEDIKAENLTQMAVDVAMGLDYLHSMKYIHRDLASRNCLVHANKTVKIADFGLTRHVSNTDYYRFSRKGMLPVRWTAPEALRDGIYSYKSDIWSYGVLVFEIVTFGSFPYQGLSNRQVVDEVLNGRQLKLPPQCTNALRSFIEWCMKPLPDYRPDLSDILDYLAYSPAFLTPCIDAPITSVVHEDTDSMGDDGKLPRSVSLHPSKTASSLTSPLTAFSAMSPSGAAKTSTPNSTPPSNSSTVLHRLNMLQISSVSTATDDYIGAGCNGMKSPSFRQKHYSSGGTEDGGVDEEWQGEHLKEKKKTFSMPGLLSSLGRSSKSAFASKAGTNNGTQGSSLSRSSSTCSDNVRMTRACGLHACVGGSKIKNSPVGFRNHQQGNDSDSDNYSNDATQGNKLSSDDTNISSQEANDSRYVGRGWPQSSSAPDSFVCDVDAEVHNIFNGSSLGSESNTSTVRNKENHFSSSSPITKMNDTGGSLDFAEMSSSGYFSQNSKGEVKQMCQNITSL